MSCFAEDIKARFARCESWRLREAMHVYQQDAVQFLKENPFSALFIDLGLGKSIISLTTILDLVGCFELDCCLVIAPLRVANKTWPDEIQMWQHTAGLSYAHIRDEDLVEAVNEAGAHARDVMKKYGPTHPEIQGLLHRLRLAEVKRKAKKEKLDLRKNRDLILRRFELVKDQPISASERKSVVEFARGEAAAKAVRDHKARNPACIYIINREQVEFLVEAWGRDWPYRAVFIDESSSLKDHKTNRFKALAKVRRSGLIDRMHQLTATPAAESYLHLFAQIYLLDLGQRLGNSYTKFTETYFKHNKYTFTYTLLPGADLEIAKQISDICLTMKAADYLQLQEPIPVIDRIELTDDEMGLYTTLELDSVVLLPNGAEVEAETAAALSAKLMQFASGVLYETRMDFCPITEIGTKVRLVHPIHDHKIERLRELREQSCGEPLLVCYHLKSSLERLKKAFPDAVPMDRDGKAVTAWNKGKIPMLLVHPQSAGHGLNLQYGGNQIVFFDIPWSLELYQQTIGRLARQGQTKAVVIHHLVMSGTLDEIIVECLQAKTDAQERLFSHLKQLCKRKLRRSTAKELDEEMDGLAA
jgi:hypothetical protein